MPLERMRRNGQTCGGEATQKDAQTSARLDPLARRWKSGSLLATRGRVAAKDRWAPAMTESVRDRSPFVIGLIRDRRGVLAEPAVAIGLAHSQQFEGSLPALGAQSALPSLRSRGALGFERRQPWHPRLL